MSSRRWRKGVPEFKNGFMKEVAFEQRIGDGADFQHVEVREKAKGWGKESRGYAGNSE